MLYKVYLYLFYKLIFHYRYMYVLSAATKWNLSHRISFVAVLAVGKWRSSSDVLFDHLGWPVRTARQILQMSVCVLVNIYIFMNMCISLLTVCVHVLLLHTVYVFTASQIYTHICVFVCLSTGAKCGFICIFVHVRINVVRMRNCQTICFMTCNWCVMPVLQTHMVDYPDWKFCVIGCTVFELYSVNN